jgi:hypothetical protein
LFKNIGMLIFYRMGVFCRVCVRDGSGALFIAGFFASYKKAGTYSPTLVVTP